MTQTQRWDDDPFAKREALPALSFNNKPIGTKYSGRVVDAPQRVQQRDFESGERATWPDGNPKMAVVTALELDDGERVSLWAPDPSAMFAAIVDAQQAAGAPVRVGGRLTVEYIGDKPNSKNPRLNPAKQYRVTYAPPNAFETSGAASSSGTQSDEPPF